MSESLYLAQVSILGIVMLWFTRRQWLMQLQILGWIFFATVIALRFGLVGQEDFYSNDQGYHADLVREILATGLTHDLNWWLSSARIPYVFPATFVAAIGIEPLLALKFVSLLALLTTTSLIQRLVPQASKREVAAAAFFSATALIGVFFASLGLRDTTMMLFVLWFFTSSSSAAKVSALVGLGILRPHLAAAVLIGSLVALSFHKLRRDSAVSPLRNFSYLAAAPVLGYYVYSLGLQFQKGLNGVFGHTWGISPVLRIASNFVGLQFLTVSDSTVEFSITSLLLLRLLLSETIIIPLLFTVAVLVTRRHSLLMQSVMWSFGIYVGIVTNTDFNSFRQNIPFMPVMGLVVLLAWKEHRERHRDVQTLPLTVPRET
ncbi:MAG: hypothetical protein EBW15_08460 [Actinobacteria bacterium]|nr:hypothetical protein [Actinomycetota bacterium]